MAERDVDPDMAQLYDLLGANPPKKPVVVPLPRPAPGREPLTKEDIEAQRLDGSAFMRRLGAQIDPAAWDKMLEETPPSTNIEDRRNDTPAMAKDRERQKYSGWLSVTTPEKRRIFEEELLATYGPDYPPEVSLGVPK
jgi:hypothetical protein